MRLHKHLRAVAAVIVLVGAAGGCSDPLSPDALVGTYEATRITQPEQRSAELRARIMSVTLDIDATEITRRIVYVTVDHAGLTRVLESLQRMRYEVEGARLVTRMPDCPPGVGCDAVLISTPDFLVFADALHEIDSGLDIVYRRVEP